MSGKSRNRSNRNLEQYGIFNVSMDADDIGDDLGGDSDLEAELQALTGNGPKQKPRRPRKPAVPASVLDSMVAESLKDIPSDEELSGDDDPDLLNELSEIAGDEKEPEESPSKVNATPTDILEILENRLKMYETAEKNAKDAGEASRAKRFGRGIKTLKDLIKRAKVGATIKDDDIPPEVTVNVQIRPNADAVVDTLGESTPVTSPHESASSENEELLKLLNSRKTEYKMAALQAKKMGDSEIAINYIKIAKQFEAVIMAVENGQPVDLSRMPGPPSQEPTRTVEETNVQTENVVVGEPTEMPEPTLITASSVAEALQQRLEVYQKQEQAAKEQENASKARRMGRIVKQYEDAIKRNKAGKPIPVEDLPTPPGYAPIPVEGSSAVQPEPPKPTPTPAKQQPSPTSVKPPAAKRNSAQARIDKQVALLMKKQKEFKDAALSAKKKGEMTQAKEFLRTAKGFDPLIDAARGGFPVDISTLPVPPAAKSQLDEEFLTLREDNDAEIDPEHLDILSRLEQQLTKQLKLSLSTRDHNKTIGDVAGMNRFEQLALSVTRDLDIIRLAKRQALNELPKFHYETKAFSIVKSFTDLNDNDLELTIVRGINYNCNNPNDIDTYVKFEFPFPQEEPVRNKTAIIKNTNNPEYNETFILPIQRNSRQCLRSFKRHGIKFEIFSKGCFASDWACCFSGFFRGDSLVGVTTVKLQPLETQCELHESFELQEGRKKVGGKLEVRLRVRDPMLTRQVEQLSEKWLVLDH